MSAWLLSIVGVVSLGVLIEIIMPEGEHSKYIKGIFSLIVVFVIVAPFPKLLDSDGITDFTQGEIAETDMDEASFEAIKESYREKSRQGFDDLLSENGVEGLEYTLTYDETYVLKADTLILTNPDEYPSDTLEKIYSLIETYFGAIDVEKG